MLEKVVLFFLFSVFLWNLCLVLVVRGPVFGKTPPVPSSEVGYTMRDIRYKWNSGLQSIGISSEVELPQFRVLGHRQRQTTIHLSTGRYLSLFYSLSLSLFSHSLWSLYVSSLFLSRRHVQLTSPDQTSTLTTWTSKLCWALKICLSLCFCLLHTIHTVIHAAPFLSLTHIIFLFTMCDRRHPIVK